MVGLDGWAQRPSAVRPEKTAPLESRAGPSVGATAMAQALGRLPWLALFLRRARRLRPFLDMLPPGFGTLCCGCRPSGRALGRRGNRATDRHSHLICSDPSKNQAEKSSGLGIDAAFVDSNTRISNQVNTQRYNRQIRKRESARKANLMQWISQMLDHLTQVESLEWREPATPR